jgi:hypothetical protein
MSIPENTKIPYVPKVIRLEPIPAPSAPWQKNPLNGKVIVDQLHRTPLSHKTDFRC